MHIRTISRTRIAPANVQAGLDIVLQIVNIIYTFFGPSGLISSTLSLLTGRTNFASKTTTS